MPKFAYLLGLDARSRLVKTDDIRYAMDREDGHGVDLTLCDGTQFGVSGSVEMLLATITKED